MTEQTVALLVAAGKSERMGADIPKPYLQVGGESLIRRSVRAFLSHPEIDGVRVVIRRQHHAFYKKAVEGMTLFPCVIGGNTRQESVHLGLESLAHRPPQRILVHDVARPMISHALISRVLSELKGNVGVIPCLPVVDTIKRARDGKIQETVSRDHLFAVQTPQAFDYGTLLEVHRKFKDGEATDDAALLEKAGLPVTLVEGDPANVKITTPADFEHMQALLSLEMETRTGFGYDVHPLVLHDPDLPISQQQIKICGVKIPFTHGLKGHSDADVGLHALVDAMLGAMSEGDIGMHFSPDDRKWQGADSERFLLHAYQLLKNRGGELTHLDVTLVCEKPKISPYRDQMINHITQLLKLTPQRVSVKATTTEKLGFEGRGEGIAAKAVATIRLPRAQDGR